MNRLPDLLPTLAERAGQSPPTPGFDPATVLKAFAPREPREGGELSTPQKALRPAFTLANLPKAKTAHPALPAPAKEEPPVPADSHRKALETAVEEARTEAAAALKDEHEANQAMAMEALAQQLSQDLDNAMAALNERICESLATALGPVLTEAMTQEAVRKFSDRLDKMISPGAIAPPIRVRGPEALIEALKKVRGPRMSGIKLQPSDQTELTAELNETTLRTTIATFTAMLKTSAKLSDLGSTHDSK